jgi:dipeptidyl aminopeptidase/acylaminoacyl peptidase
MPATTVTEAIDFADGLGRPLRSGAELTPLNEIFCDDLSLSTVAGFPRDGGALAQSRVVVAGRSPRSFGGAAGLRSIVGAVACTLWMAATAAPEARHPIRIDDLLRIQRVSDVQISPDGNAIVYTVASPSLGSNQNESNIWLASTTRSEVRQLTHTGKDRSPRWAPGGKRLAFLSKRDGKSQVFLLTLDAGEARALTHMSTDIDTVRWSPDGMSLVVSAAVYPDCNDEACNKAREEKKALGDNARVYDEWPLSTAISWMDGRRNHLFAINADGPEAPRDLTPGRHYDVPPRLGIDGSVDPDDIAISPDGKELCFASASEWDVSGQGVVHLFRVPMAGGEPQRIAQDSGNERNPAYSPDGRFIAYRSHLNSKNTGEPMRVMLYRRDAGTVINLTKALDRSASALAWTADSKTILFVGEEGIRRPLYALPVRTGAAAKEVSSGFVADISASRASPAVAFTSSSLIAPAEVFVTARPGTAPRQITHHNDQMLSTLEMAAPEPFWFKSTDSMPVQGILLRPPGFRSDLKYPLLVLLHGGPHTVWSDSWSYGWNPQVLAAPGYAVLIVNRRGSTGYGQKFSDAVINDWGGAPYQDIMAGIDDALTRYPFLDATRLAAAGASYGGYMADWLATHTNRFKTIISHAGVFDLTSLYTTDIPWFLELEINGLPWSSETFRKWSPATYAQTLGKYKTPMLITVGEKDFRVPYMQSVELFTSLQRQGVPSKLVVFPDEGHWILKPRDARLWYTTFLDWLGQYL